VGENKEICNISLVISEKENIYDEQFSIEVEGQKGIIRAASGLGILYAVFYMSENFLGIKPFWFWLDFLPHQENSIEIKDGIYTGKLYDVVFRGWFINDEVLLEKWNPDPDDENLPWKMAFETLLRLGGNMVIPGTDQNSWRKRDLAAKMGLWITHHHAEPLGSEMFIRAYPDKQASWQVNRELFIELWRKGIRSQKGYNVVWALGFRGQGDSPFWNNDSAANSNEKRGQIMSEVIRIQYDLVHEECTHPVCVINLYGEVLELYRGGFLDLPEDVIYVWADNGYGKMVSRRQGNHNPRIPAIPERAGAHGLYYHASFYDLQASNHITMLPNSAEMVCGELDKAFKAGANKYLIVNCGNIRPHCYILDLISAKWKDSNINALVHRKNFTNTYFSGNADVDSVLAEFAEHTIQYGSRVDERGGESIYHHPVRAFASAWMRGDDKSIDELTWLCSEKSFPEQVKRFREMTENAARRWEIFLEKCRKICGNLSSETGKRYFDIFELSVLIHASGCSGAVLFCKGLETVINGDKAKGFCQIYLAKKQYERSLEGFSKAEHGTWKSFFNNECFTDIRLTVDYMDALQSWLHKSYKSEVGEGPSYNAWYRRYLTDKKDRLVMLLTHTQRPLPEDRLAEELCKILMP
jgi:hypothetical protein